MPHSTVAREMEKSTHTLLHPRQHLHSPHAPDLLDTTFSQDASHAICNVLSSDYNGSQTQAGDHCVIILSPDLVLAEARAQTGRLSNSSFITPIKHLLPLLLSDTSFSTVTILHPTHLALAEARAHKLGLAVEQLLQLALVLGQRKEEVVLGPELGTASDGWGSSGPPRAPSRPARRHPNRTGLYYTYDVLRLNCMTLREP